MGNNVEKERENETENRENAIKYRKLKIALHNSQTSLIHFINNSSTLEKALSVFSASRNWSRGRHSYRGHERREFSNSKTSWPIPHIESLFLPEFKTKGNVSEHDFEVLELISKGAFGKVYKVRRKINPQVVYAMKIMEKSTIIRENAVRQVKDEVSIQAACGHHPFIASCPFYFQNRRKLFIVVEYVSGGELFGVIRNRGPLPEEIVRFVVAEIATALDFLHNAGVIYRDLKPENIMLDEEGHVKIIDFGLSKWLPAGGKTATICGTLQYIAPEILRSDSYSHAADWWSLGVLSCFLLTKQYPTKNAANVTELPTDANLTVPAKDLLSRLLQTDPKKRLRSLLAMRTVAFFKNVNFKDVITKKNNIRNFLQLRPEGCKRLDLGFFENFES